MLQNGYISWPLYYFLEQSYTYFAAVLGHQIFLAIRYSSKLSIALLLQLVHDAMTSQPIRSSPWEGGDLEWKIPTCSTQTDFLFVRIRNYRFCVYVLTILSTVAVHAATIVISERPMLLQNTFVLVCKIYMRY